jgi:hypothetical protein
VSSEFGIWNSECGILIFTARQRRAQYKNSCLRDASSQIPHPKNLRKSASSAVKKVLKNQRFKLVVRYAIGTTPLFLRAKRGKN